MSAISFNTSNQALRQLLGNGLTYCIPRFQRDYSWSEDEWDDLWQDIEGSLIENGEPAHYMGYLVLQTRDNRMYDVIDGQQRLTTLSILVLAVLAILQRLAKKGVKAEDNDTWNPDRIIDRQHWMAEQATSIWRIAQLS